MSAADEYACCGLRGGRPLTGGSTSGSEKRAPGLPLVLLDGLNVLVAGGSGGRAAVASSMLSDPILPPSCSAPRSPRRDARDSSADRTCCDCCDCEGDDGVCLAGDRQLAMAVWSPCVPGIAFIATGAVCSVEL